MCNHERLRFARSLWSLKMEILTFYHPFRTKTLNCPGCSIFPHNVLMCWKEKTLTFFENSYCQYLSIKALSCFYRLHSDLISGVLDRVFSHGQRILTLLFMSRSWQYSSSDVLQDLLSVAKQRTNKNPCWSLKPECVFLPTHLLAFASWVKW